MAEDTYDRVTWWELPVPDLAQAKEFYAAVFGWTFQSFGDYEMASKDGAMVGALDGTRKEPVGHGVAVYFHVTDLEATLARVTAAGGEVVHEPADIGGDMGRSAAFRDPAGLWLGLWAASRPTDG